MVDRVVHPVDTIPENWEAARFVRLLREHLPGLRDEFKVSSLEMFGSYVRNEQHPHSDLDLLVDFEATPSLLELVALRDHLTDLLGVKVDVTMPSGLRPQVRRYLIIDTIAV